MTDAAGLEFVWVPAGEFRMGSASAESAWNERPLTEVRISRGFWLGKFEVTQAQLPGVEPLRLQAHQPPRLSRLPGGSVRAVAARIRTSGAR